MHNRMSSQEAQKNPGLRISRGTSGGNFRSHEKLTDPSVGVSWYVSMLGFGRKNSPEVTCPPVTLYRGSAISTRHDWWC
ncbi:hypothetical protein Cadr_000012610 [Camelus dromedarius]|uniref:Uncharacterized protein n=1 Tax=Camelus dromedarius TaxID=9838 RepID=A0A5N4D9Y4_CAMDR|nr:hypothetical protein Cadr_000012610 [Camelus dromedarius]